MAALHPAARLRLYLKVVRLLIGRTSGESSGQARSRTLLDLDAALREGRGNTRFQLPGGIEAALKGGAMRFSRTLVLHKHASHEADRPDFHGEQV